MVKTAEKASEAYAVIVTGGKQHKVRAGLQYEFEKIEGQPGDEISFGEVLMMVNGDQIDIGAPALNGKKVTGKIVEQTKADKIRVIKLRRRKGYRRTQGHRQKHTVVEITQI